MIVGGRKHGAWCALCAAQILSGCAPLAWLSSIDPEPGARGDADVVDADVVDAADSGASASAPTTRDAATEAGPGTTSEPRGCDARPVVPQCKLTSGAVLPEDLRADIDGAPRYFANGTDLPAGRYSLSYVDGCMKYHPSSAWTVHATTGDPIGGLGAFWLIRDVLELLLLAPGTSGVLAGQGGFESYQACVEANCALPPKELDFSGGKLGIRKGNSSDFQNISGETVGGQGPTFRLSYLGSCR